MGAWFARGCLAACFGLFLSLGTPTMAGSYPDRMITIIVPYGPGGNADLAARALSSSARSHKALSGQNIVVENRAGAGGLVGSASVARADKDGYTLLLARVGPNAVGPALDPAVTYKWDSFSFLGLLQTEPYICVVKKNSPYKTFKDLIDAIKANPGKLNYASTGNFDASVAFPVAAFLKLGLGADAAISVPYKSGPDTTAALLGGSVDFTCNAVTPYMGPIQSGDLRALIVSSPTRESGLPDVPTAAESGFKELENVQGWSALYGPPDLPHSVIAAWSSVLSDLSKDQSWLTSLKTVGAHPKLLSPTETYDYVKKQYEFYEGLAPAFGALR